MSADANTNPNRALWEKGDFTKLAATMRASGEKIANSLGIEKGMKVLDLGCGAARRRGIGRRYRYEPRRGW